MKRPVRPFARLYYDDFQREFPDVYGDDALLATWVRLLVVAEKMWPTLPEIPRSVRSRTLARLVEADLVVLVPPHCYRIRGLDAERTRRQDAARNAAGVRWDSKGNADAYADAVPRRERDENETNLPPPPTSGGRRKDRTNPRSAGTSPRQNGHAPRDVGSSPRQERQREKTGPTALNEILRRAAAAGGES